MQTKRWLDPPLLKISGEFAAQIGGHPLLAATLARRGFGDVRSAWAFLDPTRYQPASPFDLPDMDKAVARIRQAIDRRERILVWGDFDVDGQTATALLVSALREQGVDVVYHIPHRQREGHGILLAALAPLLATGVDLLLTCDTGISAFVGIDYAKNKGVDVIVTDHHQLPPQLPDAFALVNPQRLPVGHRSRTLPGVGCAFKLIEALGINTPERLLDLVALGIVADVAEQVGDTRYLLQRGLNTLRQTERLGLKLMIELAERNPLTLNEGDIGFALGPRLNALGRLDDANPAVELLTTTDLERARILANRVEALNHERRLLSEQVYKAAVNMIERDPTLLNGAVLILSHDQWPGGIIGIVANRLVEQFNRPVILLTTAPDEPARGSARSVSGCDITAALAQHTDLLTTFGGHTMAAGLSLPPERIPDLRRALSRTVSAMLGQIDATPTLSIDGWLPLAELTPDLLTSLDRLAPFGAGNPPLVLATEKLTLLNQRAIGRQGEHLRLTVQDEAGEVMSVLWWQADPDQLPKGRFDLAYTLRQSEYQGKHEIVLEYIDSRPVDEEPITFSARTAVEVVDYRSLDEATALQTLRALQTTAPGESLVIWAEGKMPDELDEFTPTPRHHLSSARTLVIWTIPPGPGELRAALKRVNPGKVIAFGHPPGTDAINAFLGQFAGAVKYALRTKEGSVSLDELAAAVGHRAITARAGLSWMVARGHIHIIEEEGVLFTLREGGSSDPAQHTPTTTRLAELLKETANYRAYFRQMTAAALAEPNPG